MIEAVERRMTREDWVEFWAAIADRITTIEIEEMGGSLTERLERIRRFAFRRFCRLVYGDAVPASLGVRW